MLEIAISKESQNILKRLKENMKKMAERATKRPRGIVIKREFHLEGEIKKSKVVKKRRLKGARCQVTVRDKQGMETTFIINNFTLDIRLVHGLGGLVSGEVLMGAGVRR